MITDLEGSTKKWERDKAAMSSALVRHDQILLQERFLITMELYSNILGTVYVPSLKNRSML